MKRFAAAYRKIFLRFFHPCAGVSLLFALAAYPLFAQQSQGSSGPQYVIQRIEFVGNRRIQRDTLLSRIFSRQGDPYSEDAVRRDFQALWNTQFFEDIRLEVEDSPDMPNGKIVVFYVTERPIIRRIEYKGNKSITESDILDAFKDKKVGLSVESQFDPTKIIRAVVVIKELLAEHGRQFATVKPTYERIASTNAVKLVFNINEGPKVKVGKISFTGNTEFSDRKLIRAMHHDRPYGIPLGLFTIPVLGKTFDRDKLDEDLEVGVRGLYTDNGYYRVNVGDPILKTVDENRSGIPGPWPIVGAKHGKRTDITIPIEEGEQYRMGKLTFRSADPDQGLVFKAAALERIFPLHQGDIFSTSKIRKALENYKKLYGDYGYIDFTSEPQTNVNDATKTVDVTMVLDQGKQFFVRRIEFTGNTTTRDKVIRRELLLDEGQVYNNRLWELSILRLNQLGYFDTIKPENAELKRNVKAGTVDIRLKLKEKGKQSISFSGGVSGIAGSFIGASYQTNNFLGLGETLTISAQVGDIQKNVLFGFTEPYLFDRPISAGFTVFLNDFNYNQARETGLLLGQQIALNPALEQNYTTNSKGFTIFATYPLRRYSFTRVGVTYSWSTTNISAFSQSAQLLFDYTKFTNLAGPSALNGIVSSQISPTISYSTVDSPISPTHGKSFYYTLNLAGGFLGGNVDTISNTFTAQYFHPTYHHRNVIALRVLSAWITGYNGRDVPPYNRFYLGGENDVRGFDFYTISPFVQIPYLSSVPITYLDQTHLVNGSPELVSLSVPTVTYFTTRPGGDFQTVGNVEYRIPIAGPVELRLFNDFGIDGIIQRSQLAASQPLVQQLQQQYPNPLFPSLNFSSKLPVLGNTNFLPHTSAGIEIGVQLPVVNAPFRFYYAYNYLRLTGTLTGSRGGFYLTPEQINYLKDIGVLDSQVLPTLNNYLDEQVQRLPANLVEPRQTFRFTVGKTF